MKLSGIEKLLEASMKEINEKLTLKLIQNLIKKLGLTEIKFGIYRYNFQNENWDFYKFMSIKKKYQAMICAFVRLFLFRIFKHKRYLFA